MTIEENGRVKPPRIGIYGGTFAPPHFGHIRAAKAFLAQLGLDAAYVVPTSIPPHKRLDCADNPSDRLEMLRLALSGEPEYGGRLLISDYELNNSGKSYTVLTLEHFKESLSDDLTFLCGADMFVTLESWYRSADIFRLAKIAYVRRSGTTGLDTRADFYRVKYGAVCIPIDMEPVETSSSEIRRRLEAGEDVSGLVPEAVLAYIRQKNLYQDGKT